MNGSGSSRSTSETMNELFYEIADNLSQKYPALTPFVIRREKFGEVVRLISWINGKNLKNKGIQSTDKVWKDSKGDIHIRRPAQNDNWW